MTHQEELKLDGHLKMPVDSENKAKRIRLLSFGQPHMRAFHLAWFAFFMTFLATFAPAALTPPIRENLGVDKWQIGSAGVAAVCGAIFSRLLMGTLLDTVGARLGTACVVLLFAPAVFCMSLITDAATLTVVRFFIGCSLCMFVCTQFWVGQMFNARIVGTALSVSSGFGTAGGGACHLLMPLLYEGLKRTLPGFTAWRWAFFVPGGLYLLVGVVILLTGQDGAEGDYRDMKAQGKLKAKGAIGPVFRVGLGNYRTWVLATTYAMCFGIELTMDNIIVTYLFDQFNIEYVKAGALGSIFGLMNVVSRGSGGMLSDLAASRFGMRGRLWTLFIIQVAAGGFAIIMAHVDYSLSATIGVMVVFSLLTQQACGAHYGIAPFVSRRAYGMVAGMMGAGGNIGAMIIQFIFFAGAPTSPALTTQEGIKWMGVLVMCVTCLLAVLGWPMWGSMFSRPNPDYMEEDYYLREWTAEEAAQGLHSNSLKFAMESRSQRGSYRGGDRSVRSNPSSSSGGIKAAVAAAVPAVGATKPAAPAAVPPTTELTAPPPAQVQGNGVHVDGAQGNGVHTQ